MSKRRSVRKPRAKSRSSERSSKVSRSQRSRSLPASQQSAEDVLRLATQDRAAGRVRTAREHFEHVLQIVPNHAVALMGLAFCMGRLGDSDRAITFALQALKSEPTNAKFHANLADLYAQTEQSDLAKDHAERAIEIDPTVETAYVQIARILEQQRQFDAALDVLQRAYAHVESHFELDIAKSRLLGRLKKHDDAITLLDTVLSSSPLRVDLAPLAYHERANANDRIGNFERAYADYVECGQRTASLPVTQQFSKQANLAMIAGFRRGLENQSTLDRFRAFSYDPAIEGRAPAFLIGFSRSGTTLTEQVLASHSQLYTTNERPFIGRVKAEWAKMVGGSDDVQGMFDRLTRDHVVRLRQTYWEAVAQSGCQQRGDDQPKQLVDKLPLNTIYLGLIHAVFPDAKMLMALRDPRDVCLSCFFQNFRMNNANIHFLNLKDTAHLYASVMELYVQLRSSLGSAVLEIKYEDTVTDLRSQALRVLEHLECPWEDSVLEFHERARSVSISTPSALAVTEPVHTGSVARWKHYLKPTLQVYPQLERFVQTFGYPECEGG